MLRGPVATRAFDFTVLYFDGRLPASCSVLYSLSHPPSALFYGSVPYLRAVEGAGLEPAISDLLNRATAYFTFGSFADASFAGNIPPCALRKYQSAPPRWRSPVSVWAGPTTVHS